MLFFVQCFSFLLFNYAKVFVSAIFIFHFVANRLSKRRRKFGVCTVHRSRMQFVPCATKVGLTTDDRHKFSVRSTNNFHSQKVFTFLSFSLVVPFLARSSFSLPDCLFESKIKSVSFQCDAKRFCFPATAHVL